MALFTGVRVTAEYAQKQRNKFLDRYRKLHGHRRAKKGNIFPDTPQIPLSEWRKLRNYYLQKAPETLSSENRPELQTGQTLFRVRTGPPADRTGTTFVQILPGEHHYMTGHARDKLLYLHHPGQRRTRIKSPSSPVHARFYEHHLDVLAAGHLPPNDALRGKLFRTPLDNPHERTTLLDSLPRPVHFSTGLVNEDRKKDYVVSGFGMFLGELSLYINLDKSGYERKVTLKKEPGAIKTTIRDLNGDGRNDVIAMFGQKREGVYVFYNQGNGNVREERVIEFPPTYGSSSFKLTDLNGDGHPDLLTTNGDNGDYPNPILKPYHGVRIFLNDGENRFRQVYFFPMHGAYDAEPIDFDLDGDRDILAISHFPDLENRPEESIVYLENRGSFRFRAYTIMAPRSGRWLVLDTGDLDGDGDKDAIIGNHNVGRTLQPHRNDSREPPTRNSSPQYIFLRNLTK